MRRVKMSAMKIIKTRRDKDAFLKRLARRGEGVSQEVTSNTEKIIRAVRNQGDRALLRFTKRFDGHEKLRIRPAEIKKYAARAEKSAVKALLTSARRIRKFHERQKEKSWEINEKGVRLGQIIRPIERVGIYVPGGIASYPSTVLMNVIPAQVAGVKEIAVAVPAPDGEINPEVMAALKMLGVDEVYCMGGAQAVAALAYGTESIRKVDKITGPGNIYVSTAKKMVYGSVDIDMIAGPSEILIIADSLANPAFVAADLLSQAEHDELASAVLITDSAALADAVNKELGTQLRALNRKAIARKSLRSFGASVMVRDMKEAVGFANRIAPEHLEIMTRAPRKLLPEIRNAGAVFLGRWTPEALGDYSAGPNHTLPTGATARFSSALGVYDFIKRTSLVEFDRSGFMRIARTVLTLAETEGLQAHAESVRKRIEEL
jgi:histidinol dehydrogenase